MIVFQVFIKSWCSEWNTENTMSHIYLNEESEAFHSTTLHHKNKLNIPTPQVPIYYIHIRIGLLALSTWQKSSSFGSWCSWTKQGGWVNLSLYLFVPGVNQVKCKSEVSPRVPFVTAGVWELPLRPTMSEVA